MIAASAIERYGVPIDIEMLQRLRQHWDLMQRELIAAIDADYGVYDGRTFKLARFGIGLQPGASPGRG